ncbi:MAG: PilZ domain-containing protein [Alteraurantiacibacter sp.]
MTTRAISSASRYAMRVPINLHTGNAQTCTGLLIELSQDGMRVSGLDRLQLDTDQVVTLSVHESQPLDGTIRWARDGIAGIRLNKPLHLAELEVLLDFNHAFQRQDMPRYGT